MYDVTRNFCTNLDISGLKHDGEKIQDLMNESVQSLVPVENTFKVEKTEPEMIGVGDLISGTGFIGKVEKIFISETENKPPCYSFSVSYVAGNLSNFIYLIGNICNGCFRGNLAHIQGNKYANWQIVKS